MPVAFACRAPQGTVWSRYLATRARQILRVLAIRRSELSLSLVGDAEMRELNRAHRGKNRPTDVLAFPLHEPPIPPDAASLGDVVISIDTATLAARQRRRPLATCLDELLVHGVLHLLGYDHEISPAEERRMARKARQVRAAMGPLPAPARERALASGTRSPAVGPEAARVAEARTWDVARPRVTVNGGPPAARRILPPDAPVLDGRRALGLAAVSGALLALAFPIIDWGPVAWVALVPLLLAALGRGPGSAFRTGWVAGFVFFLATLYWLVLTIGTYTNLSPLVSVGPLVLLCAFLALGFGIVTAGCEAARARGIELALVAPPLWVLVEWIRTYILGGFPWVSLGYSQYRATYLVQFVEVTGIYGLSALVVLVNVVVYGAVRRWLAGEAPSTRGMLAVTVLLVALVAWGYWRVQEVAALPAVGSLRVGLIQGNVAQDVKWDPAYQDSTIDHYERLTKDAVAEGAELVVWPETAAPFFFQQDGELRDRILDLARRLRIWIVVGSPAFSDQGGTCSACTIASTWSIPTAAPSNPTTR